MFPAIAAAGAVAMRKPIKPENAKATSLQFCFIVHPAPS
jgi:hypothetical protein